MGFEPTRAEHIGLAVQRLNHSATSSSGPNEDIMRGTLVGLPRAAEGILWSATSFLKGFPMPGIEPGPPG